MRKRITLIVSAGILAVGIAGGFAGGLASAVHDNPLEDPYNGVPQCTDSIADAGGICHGEPIADSAPTPSPSPSQLVAEPVADPVVIEQHEAEPSAIEAPSQLVADLPPCATEDSDNCYWDAATMGNGTGRSFVAFHGQVYYNDVPVEDFGSELRTVTLNGVTMRYVDGSDAILYCELPLEVGIDEDDNGNQWAGCM